MRPVKPALRNSRPPYSDPPRQAAAGEIEFLKSKRFVLIDCSHVSPEDSRAFLEALFTECAQKSGLEICPDGLASVLKRPMGGDNKKLLRQPRVQLIGHR